MKPKIPTHRVRRQGGTSPLFLTAITLSFTGATVFGAVNNWTGATSSDWNTPGNWSSPENPTPEHIPQKETYEEDAVINTASGNIATISADLAAIPRDIIVGTGAGNTGILHHTAGQASTGDGNWMFVGTGGGTGTYNLADTTTAGGGISGFGTGSGSTTVAGRLYVGGFNGGGSNGTVNVNTSGTLAIGSQLQIGEGGSTGSFNLENGAVTTGGGWVEVGNNGTGTLNISGGSLTKSGADNFIIASNGGTGTLNVSGGELNVNNEFWIGQGADSVGDGTLSAGKITVNSWVAVGRGTGTGSLQIDGGTFDKTGGGNFIVGDDSKGTLNQTAGQLNINGELWVGQASQSSSYTMTGGTASVNNWIAVGRNGGTGTLDVSSGTITKTGGGSFTVGGGGTGTLNVSGDALVDIQSGNLFIGEVGGQTSSLTQSGGEIRVANLVLGVVGTTSGNANLDGGVLRVGRITSGSFLDGRTDDIDDSATSTANVTFNGTQIIATGDQADFISKLDSAVLGGGGLKLDSGVHAIGTSQVLTGTGGLTKSGVGTLTLGAANTYSGATVVQAGTLALSDGAAVGGSSTIEVAAGAFLDVSATGGWTLGSGQALRGNGTLTGSAILAAGSVVAPGNSIGTLTVTGDLTLQGLAAMEVMDGTSDAIQIAGALFYGGTLDITNIGGPLTGSAGAPTVFDLFDFTSQSGTFDAINLPTLDAGYSWTSFDYSTGSIAIVPEPSTLLLGALGSLALFRRRRG